MKDRGLPPLHEQAWNLAKTLARFVRHPALVSKKQYEERLRICDSCPHRAENRCSLCGCFIEMKAYMKEARCDDDRWPA